MKFETMKNLYWKAKNLHRAGVASVEIAERLGLPLRFCQTLNHAKAIIIGNAKNAAK